MKINSIVTGILIIYCLTFGIAQEFFEGELIYKVDYELINENIPVELLENEMGNSFLIL